MSYMLHNAYRVNIATNTYMLHNAYRVNIATNTKNKIAETCLLISQPSLNGVSE